MKKTIFILIMTFCLAIKVDAASFGANASVQSVNPNGKFTISVGGDSIGRVNLTATNATLSTSSVWVEQNYQTVTVTAGGSGVITITATPVAGYSDPDANIYNPGPRVITVSISSGSSSTSKPTTPTVNKSKDNNLSSLKIDHGSLTPSFDKNVTEYTVNLTKDITSLTITATPSDTKAKVSGAQKVDLKPGLNKISITVTAENGSKKVYKISAYVDETPEVFLDYANHQIGIVRNTDDIALEHFEKEKHTIDGKDAILFKGGNLTLIYGIDEEGHKNFYLYDEEKNIIGSVLIPITIAGKDYYIISSQEGHQTLDIEGKELPVKTTEIDDYYLIETVDIDGNIKKYLYETKENTMLLFADELLESSTCEKSETLATKIVLFAMSISILFFIGLTTYLYKRMTKNEKAN